MIGNSDIGLARDAALEAQIDAEWKHMQRAPSDRESQDALTEVAVLMRRRSDTQVLKLEFQRRALMAALKGTA